MMANVEPATTVDYSTREQVVAISVVRCAMIDTDELERELKNEGRIIELLVQRSIKQSKDIQELKRELENMKDTPDDDDDDSIRSKQMCA